MIRKDRLTITEKLPLYFMKNEDKVENNSIDIALHKATIAKKVVVEFFGAIDNDMVVLPTDDTKILIPKKKKHM